MSAAAIVQLIPHDGPVTFTSRAGQNLRLEFSVETVASLRHGTPAAARIARAVVDTESGAPLAAADLARLPDEDHLRIDEETFVFSNLTLDAANTPSILIVPISFHTLAGRKGRRELTERIGERLKTRVLLELMDVDRGTPLSRLSEVGGLATLLSRGVLVRLAAGRDPTAAVRGYRPHGVTLDACDLGATDTDLASGMLAFGEQAKGSAPTLMVFGLPSEDFFAVASVGGITHASARRAASASADPDGSER
ncbi:MAG TPA: hypothetical protein VF459_17755 [Caulobacteraceae bacterium]